MATLMPGRPAHTSRSPPTTKRATEPIQNVETLFVEPYLCLALHALAFGAPKICTPSPVRFAARMHCAAFPTPAPRRKAEVPQKPLAAISARVARMAQTTRRGVTRPPIDEIFDETARSGPSPRQDQQGIYHESQG
eukprot:5396449-Pleurochrysis_carterae.AAC.2